MRMMMIMMTTVFVMLMTVIAFIHVSFASENVS